MLKSNPYSMIKARFVAASGLAKCGHSSIKFITVQKNPQQLCCGFFVMIMPGLPRLRNGVTFYKYFDSSAARMLRLFLFDEFIITAFMQIIVAMDTNKKNICGILSSS